MNCAHVLDLIDAGPFVDVAREQIEAAHAHARQCHTCGPALDASTSLTVDLRAIPEPGTPPLDLASVVMARIAQIAEVPTPTATARTRNWSGVATVVGGMAAGVAIVATTPIGPEVIAGLFTPRGGGVNGLALMPATLSGALTIGAGVVLYVTGLFGVVRQSP